MTIQQLKYIKALSEKKNYGRAAEVLGISQPALSLQIKKLEEELDFQLVDRTQKKVSITSKGSSFLNQAQMVLNQYSQLEKLSKQLKNETPGILRVGVIPTLAPYLIPLFIEDMVGLNPDIQLSVKELLTEDIMKDLNEGNLDAGIISTPISTRSEYIITPLFYEKFLLFVSPDHPLYKKKEISVKDIPISDIRLLSEGNCFRNQVSNICGMSSQYMFKSNFHFESTNIESLCRIIESRGGVTFLPELTTLHISDERSDLIKKIRGNKNVREISMINLPKHVSSNEINILGGIIKSNIPKKMLSLSGNLKVSTGVEL